MGKLKSKKLEKWTTQDTANNVLIAIFNVLITFVLFVTIKYLAALKTNPNANYFSFFGNVNDVIHTIVLLILVAAVIVVYFFFEDRSFLKKPANLEMIFLIVEVCVVVCSIFSLYVNSYIRPLALVALLTLFLTNRRHAMFMQVIFCIIVLLTDTIVTNAQTLDSVMTYLSLVIGYTSGLLAIFCMGKVNSRGKLLIRSIFISFPTVICVAVPVIGYGTENVLISLFSGLASGPIAVGLFILFLPIFEGIFRKITCFKLAELTDHKSKLIRKMIKNAPGTFNHAIVVSNIAEACAIAIDEDALLARTCAYYHDVGKLRRPEFFSENQPTGVNPHDDLTPELSTNIIKAHAQDGYEYAVKSRLPKEIADVCVQHHGTLPILYFYNKAKKFTDGEVDVKQYCYEGPKPQTKIAAIIMIADGCEAVIRTLKDRSRENVLKTVNKIIDDRMDLGQFDECEITIKELDIIAETIVNNCTGIYHSRVKYPKIKITDITE